jgi:gliding motility-associated-like protein
MFKIITTLMLSSFVFFIANGQVLINEYSAANYDTYTDNYGEYEDWVELYNPTATAIDISGWYLSDKVNNPTKWVVPSSFIVPANGTVIIYCSGRDELVGGNAHSNFKITQTKGNEVFMLSDAGSVLQDSIRVFTNQNSHTRGRETNGAANWSVFMTGTPNTNNVGALQEYATTPIFSQSGGYNSAAVNLTLSSPDPNITIYYTTNGDEPNNGSTVYSGAINIATTTIVKAIAYSSTANIPTSFIDYHTFFINDTHTIPILSISGGQVDNLLNGNGWLEPEGTVEWFGENGILLDKGTGEFNKHGNDSWAYDQRGFDYIMRDQFGYNYAIKDKIFMTKDRDKFQRVILKAAANDNYPESTGGAHIRDSYCHHLSQLADLRMDERSNTNCIVYLNGEYWGVYDLREKADDHDFTDYYYDQDKNNLQYLKTWGGTWTEYGAPNAQPDWDTFKNWVLANPMSNQANYNQAKSEYNMGSLIDYFLLNAYVVCSDWLNWNTAWWRGMDPNGDKRKWRYVLWDLDATFDHYINYTGVPSTSANAEPCDPSTLGDPGGQGHVPIWNEMLTNQEFHDDYINRWQDLANGPFSCTYMINLLDSMIAVIDPEMTRHIATWGGTYAGWQNNVTDLRNFILARCDSMNSGFVDCDTAITGIFDVTVEIIGIGEVEMSNSNIINDLNTPFTDQRFGGINLPFEVKSGPFDHWEVFPTGAYVYDPNVDTLVIDLQGDITVQAYFVPPTPTRDITYNVIPGGTATTITVDGVVISAFPSTINYIIQDTVNISPNINPLYGFSTWASDSVTLMPLAANMTDSFYVSNHDNVTLYIYELPTITAFISGNDTICDNGKTAAEVLVSFSGISPYTFTYAINGITQPSVTTSVNPYPINTSIGGNYILQSFADINEIGGISGGAIVTVLESPIANFDAQPDSMTILYTTTQCVDKSIGSIINWQWDFGDNTASDFTENPYHTYPDSIAMYQLSLIIIDEMGCADTIFKHIFISDDYWIYIPNSFTPDLDGINDKFFITYHGIREATFTFNVYNRNSDLVYSTNNIHDLDTENGWDGKHQSTGTDLPMGAYIYEIYYQDFQGWKHQDISEILIVR